ncbi:uncharacterized protein SPSK_02589 [Sporothrix schenckii 1099-18]|uniref:BRCT domain-containing protein n=1 Tax=Sporothrix schenckii 1099-18 TaxID=1397361 RepID=A0A0F2MAP9_SPOSC|nr:uncharacterized protein SPSK_02589 [Sporothrix schenckii 1099-18]KJR86773.1 hypothetical protein SPSK_02589 [Sporothrix schenckii 1099-18]
MDSHPLASSPALSLTPPLPLHEKELLFTDWGLSDTDNSQPATSSGTVEKPDSRWTEREREHRRKSKAFAAAAKAAVEKVVEKAAEEAAREARADEAALRADHGGGEHGGSDSDDVVEIIDLTQPELKPPGPPQTLPRPPRRTASTVAAPVRPSSSTTLRRTSSNPLPDRRGPKRKREEVLDRATAARKTGRPAKTTTKKDARDISPPLVPEGQRIFAGLSFCYLPNGAFGARKLRINKARQHGARWVQNLREATHVVVDKQLRWADVEAHVRDELATMLSTDPEPAAAAWPILVNETYPLDCIGFRHLLNPEQLRYRVTGWKEAQAAQETATGKGPANVTGHGKTSDTSPPGHYLIKPDRREQDRLGAARQQEHMIRQPRHDV